MKNKWLMIIGTIVLMMAMMFAGCDTEQKGSEQVRPKVKRYTVQFNANGGSGTMADLSADVGEEITLPANAFNAPTGKEFDSWNTLQDGSGTSYSANAKCKDLTTDDGAVVTLFAKWGDIKYTYTFKANGGKWSDDTTADKTVRGIYQSNVDKPANPTKAGYSFTEWDKAVPATFDASDDTFTAQWTVNQYTVTLWNDGDQSGDISVDVTYDTIVPNITIPSKIGYTFGGYYTEADGSGTKYINADGTGSKEWDIADNVTLYALFIEKDAHNIIYLNAKTAVIADADKKFRESKNVTLPTITAAGYEFGGWSLVNGDVTADGTIDGWNAGAYTADVTLWARMTALSYTVTLSNDADDNSGDASVTAVFDTIVPSITIPSKIGYTFGGYYTEADGSGTKYINADGTGSQEWDIAENVTLYALFIEKDAHNIIYLNTKTAVIADADKKYRESKNVTLPTITAAGYEFGGWSLVTDDVTADNTIDGWNAGAYTADVTLWARMNAIEYNITYTGIEGATNPNTASKYTIEDEIALANASKVGYTFAGWHNGSTVVTQIKDSTGDIALTAQWNIITYNITYANLNGVTNPNVTTYDIEHSVTLSPLSKAGYTFDGWSVVTDVTADDTITGWNAGTTADVTLWARWTPVEVNYTVKTYFQKVDGTGYEQNLTEYADITKQGLTDTTTAETAEDVTGFDLQPIVQQTIAGSGSTVVEVQYNRKNIDYTFNAAGGEWSDNTTADKTVSGLYGAAVDIPVPTRTGYSFNSWDKTVPSVFDATNNTFTAQWTANTYTIVFNANGGTGTMANLPMTYDVSADLPTNSFTKENYLFKGWSEDNNATSADYGNVQNVKNLTAVNGAEITLYAVWQIKYGLSEEGNFILNCVEYSKTSMQQVLSESTVITCDQFEGVFPSARGSVTLGKYTIGKYEVTQQLYTAVMGNNPSWYIDTNAALENIETNYLLRPVERVNWYNAIVFCNKLSLLMGKTRCYKLKDGTYPDDDSNIGSIPTDDSSNVENWYDMICDWSADGYRLPTECEWECAARGGVYSTTTPWTYTYSGSNEINDVAIYLGNSYGRSRYPKAWEVGLLAPNTLGLYDMSGNVAEWCWDNKNSAAIDDSTPVTGPATNSSSDFERMWRGGAFEFSVGISTVAFREPFGSAYCSYSVGFRLACSGE